MNCYLFRLRFNTAVHFGSSESALSLYTSEDHFRADTLFSALCHTASQLYGSKGTEKLINHVKSGKVLLSDSMPWIGNDCYLPKPCFAVQTERELPAEKRKAIKKLSWIPGNRLDEYCSALKTGFLFECNQPSFGSALESVKAAVPEARDALPYPIGLFRFYENCGLYFLVSLENSDDLPWFTSLVEALGVTGIGGKTTAGYGKFSVESTATLSNEFGKQTPLSARTSQTYPHYLLLTTSLPKDEELDAALSCAYFQLCRRAGFIAADSETPRKKQTQYYISAGAVLQNQFAGDLYQIGSTPNFPVYRYSKPLFLGVPL